MPDTRHAPCSKIAQPFEIAAALLEPGEPGCRKVKGLRQRERDEPYSIDVFDAE